MASRLELREVLLALPNVKKVYFQPPSTVKLEYPCIIYKLSTMDSKYANNQKYLNTKRYQLIIIDKNPDSEIADKALELPMCSFERAYSSDNLNHWVLNLYF